MVIPYKLTSHLYSAIQLINERVDLVALNFKVNFIGEGKTWSCLSYNGKDNRQQINY